MKSSDTLDRNDLPLTDCFPCRPNRPMSVNFRAGHIYLRAAFVTTYGLGIITTRSRVRIFFFTRRTQGKVIHTRSFPIIGHRLHNGQSRSASRTVNKGMQIATIRRIEELPFTFITNADIGRYKNMSLIRGALNDGKAA